VTGLDAVLKDNGGQTFTHALLPGSNAIDAGGSCTDAPVNRVDQRGAARDAQCDLGAYEFSGIAATSTPTNTPLPRTATPSLTPSNFPATSTNTPSRTPRPSATWTSSKTPTHLYTKTPTPFFWLTPSDTPTETITPSPTPSETAFPTLTPSETQTVTPTDTAIPTAALTENPIPTLTVIPTDTATVTPSATITESSLPSDTATVIPTDTAIALTLTPSASPTLNLTATPTPEINLLVNGGFEADSNSDGVPDGWSGKNLIKDKRKCNKPDKQVAYEGSCAFVFCGSEKATLSQNAQIAGEAGDLLTLDAMVAAKGALVDAKIGLKVVYQDDGLEAGKLNLVIDAAGDYPPYSGSAVVANDGIEKLKVKIQQRSGKVSVDAVRLRVEPGERWRCRNSKNCKVATPKKDIMTLNVCEVLKRWRL
jgi:hypothetical protein